MPTTATQGTQLHRDVCVLCTPVLKHPSFRLDPETGELLIKNHTDSNTGTYVCEVKNAVGQAQCKYKLNAYNRKSMRFM